MQRVKLILILAALSLALGCTETKTASKVKIGKPLPAWTEGELDIHFINTGRGESTWHILPDGTTFLVDASGSLMKMGENDSDPLPAKPSAELSAGKVIVDYINHFNPEVSCGHINYFMLTHFDMDHMGAYSEELPLHESGRFRLASLMEIGTSLVIDHIYDRSYPDFTYPTPARHKSEKTRNYREFLKWTEEVNGTVLQAWKAGATGQIRLLHKEDARFGVRNYSANGRYWTGEGEESDTKMPATDGFLTVYKGSVPKENAFANSFILSFGDFDFFHGGDIQYNDRDKHEYMDIETPISKVAHKVELMKANHHGTAHTNGSALLSTLRPDVVVFTPWRDVHPREESLVRFRDANPYISMFCTQMPELNRETLGQEWLSRFTAMDGHVVVRVASDAKSYMIYLLDDNDQEYRVLGSYGPYECRPRYANTLVRGRSARELFDSDSLNALSVYRPYPEVTQAQIDALTEAPDGYKPVYFSSYVRHGQRKLHRDEYTDYPLSILEKASAEGQLTPLGERILAKIRIIDRDLENSLGILTPLGEEQHEGIARRMYGNYPELFSSEGLHIHCFSTVYQRTMMSMFTESETLSKLNPSVVVSREASDALTQLIGGYHDAYKEEPHIPFDEFLSAHFDARPVLERLFGANVPVLDEDKLVRNLYVTGADAGGLDLENVTFLSSLFTADELFVIHQGMNSMLYTRTGSSSFNGHNTLPSMIPLMDDFICRADAALASATPSADLRFGHDSYLIPFVGLLGLNGYNVVEPDPLKYIDVFQDYMISPMAGNVQMVLYSKSAAGLSGSVCSAASAGSAVREDRGCPDGILVKFLLNETECSLPIGTDVYPYYHWEDVKAYCASLKEKYGVSL